MIRVAIDTNIFLSGVFFDKNPEKLLRLGINGDVNLIIPHLVIEQANRKMIERKVFSDKAKSDAVRDFIFVLEKACCEEDGDIVHAREFSVKCRDKTDEPIINQVCKINPDYFITGDKDILEIENPPIRICTLTDFFKEKFPELLDD